MTVNKSVDIVEFRVLAYTLTFLFWLIMSNSMLRPIHTNNYLLKSQIMCTLGTNQGW